MNTREAKQEYLILKRAAGHEVRKAENDEWRKLGESLQGDYVNNQRKASIRSTVKGNQDVGRICDNNGQLLCDEKEVRTRWRDYFASLLESDQSNTQVPGQMVEQRRDQGVNQLDVDCAEKINVEEVRECIRRLKNRKTPGICGITGEMLKAGGDAVVQWLHRIFCVAWGSGTVPADWRKAKSSLYTRRQVEHSVRTIGELAY